MRERLAHSPRPSESFILLSALQRGGSPRRTSSPGPFLSFLCQPGSEGESVETKQPVAFCPEFGVELIDVSVACQTP